MDTMDSVELLDKLQAQMRETENRLASTITTGLGAVNVALAALSERLHTTTLEQERRNAHFADRDRVEQIAQHVHSTAGEVMGLVHRTAKLEQTVDKLGTEETATTVRESTSALSIFTTTSGWLVAAVIMLLGVILTFALTSHGIK